MISKYLYSKVNEAKTSFISLFLEPEDILFLEKHHVTFQKNDNRYQVDADKLKALFCH